MRNKEKTTRTKLIGKLHLLKAQLHQTEDEYRAFLASFKVKSSTLLSDAELIRAIGLLQELLDGKSPALVPVGTNERQEKPAKPSNADKWKDPEHLRKCVMAAIGAWLRSQNRAESAQIIIGIALASAGEQYKDFNKIPINRLMNIYKAFTNKKKLAQDVDSVKAKVLADLPEKKVCR